jgi:hypothetical protein
MDIPGGELEYPIGWIESEWPDYEDQHGSGGSVKRPISVQIPIDVDETAISRTRHGELPACWAGRGSSSIGMNRAVDEASWGSAGRCM